MNISISNIGIINTAELQLKGLTVVAGENNSGKTTIGKIIFSITKALNNCQSDYYNRLAQEYRSIFVKIYERIENNIIVGGIDEISLTDDEADVFFEIRNSKEAEFYSMVDNYIDLLLNEQKAG